MNLDTTTRSIEVVLGAAITTNQLKVSADWSDVTTSTGAYAAGNTSLDTNSTTAVTAVAAPGSGIVRAISRMGVYNADTVAAAVTVRMNDNSTLRTRVKITLQPGYTLFYASEEGWKTISDAGLVQLGTTVVIGIATKHAGMNDQTGTSYTFGLGDAGKDVRFTNASTVSATVPPNSSVAFDIGTFIFASQGGAGVVSLAAGSGVTLRAANGSSTSGIYDARAIEKTDTDVWRIW